MRCADCPNWQVLPTNGSSRGDSEMELMGYRNCRRSGDPAALAAATLLHGSTVCRAQPRDQHAGQARA